MKKNIRFSFLVITIFTVTLSACGGTTIPVTGSDGTVQTLPTTFIAVVENITGTQWTLSGQTLTVDPGVVSEGPFDIGDVVKVEVVVNQDGTFAVSSIEAPTVQELSILPRLDGTINSNNANNNDNVNVNSNTNVNSNDNTNNANLNDNTNTNSNVNNNSNDNNSNDTNSNGANSNDDNDNNSGGNQNNNDNDNNGNDNDENDNDSSGPGSGGNDNDENNGNDNDDNDNG